MQTENENRKCKSSLQQVSKSFSWITSHLRNRINFEDLFDKGNPKPSKIKYIREGGNRL